MSYFPVPSPAQELPVTAVVHIDEIYRPSRDWTDHVTRARLQACTQYVNRGLIWRPEWL